MRTLNTKDKFIFEDQCPSGFTLVELLVVLAIVSVLAALLLPAMAQAKAKAQSAVCQGNLKQLQLAWLNYAYDHEDQLAPNRIDSPRGYAESLPGSWVVGNAKIDLRATNIERGVLFPYSRATALYRCPSDKSTTQRPRNLRRTRSYSMNYFLNTQVNGFSFVPGCGWLENPVIQRVDVLREKTVEPFGKAKLGQLMEPPPEKVFVFLDVHPDSIDSGGFNLHPPLSAWEHLPSDRHSQGANLSFADGHVERYRWRSPKIFASTHQFTESPSDLEDFRRLAAGMPYQR